MKATRLVALMTSLASVSCLAQAVDPAQVAGAQKENAAALRKYVWTQRSELKLKGETKKVTLNQVRYDLEGKQQKTLLSEESPQQQEPSGRRRGGPVKQKIVEKKKGEFKEMLEGLVGLVTSYTHIPPEKLKAAMAQAQTGPGQGDMQGTAQARLKDVMVGGDELVLWLETGTLLFRRIEIHTLYDKHPVTVTADYSTLPAGESYMARATVQYPEKEVGLRIDNYDYHPGP